MVRASPSERRRLGRIAQERGVLAPLVDPELRPGLLWLSGPEAASFLEGQLTHEVVGLGPGAGRELARLSRKGQLVDLLSVHRLPEAPAGEQHLLLLTAPGRAAALTADLAGYQFSEDFQLADLSEHYDWLLLAGPRAADVLQAAFGPVPADADAHWATLPAAALRSLGGQAPRDRSLVFARGLAGAGFLVATPREADLLTLLLDRLGAPAAEAELVRPEGDALRALIEMLRVEAGMPWPDRDFEPGRRLLPETGLEQGLVSWTKGCYLGQEIVARVRAHGSARQALRGLVFAPDAELSALPAPGEPVVTADGERIGEWASRAWSPGLERPAALAYLDRKHRRPGLVVEVAGLHAEVRLLPLVRDVAAEERAAFLYDEAVRVFAAGGDERALALLEEALRLEPGHAESWEAVGVILGRSGRYAEAIDTFRRLEEIAPDEPMVHTNLSLYFMKVGDIEAAERHRAAATMKRFGALASQAAAEELAAAEAAKARADAERRLAMFAEVLEFDAEDPLALMGAGKALSELDRDAEAEPYLARACGVQKDNSPLFALHGKVLERLGRAADARAVYERGIETASRKGDLMPLREMENRLLLLR